jgi:hypothetical protein
MAEVDRQANPAPTIKCATAEVESVYTRCFASLMMPCMALEAPLLLLLRESSVVLQKCGRGLPSQPKYPPTCSIHLVMPVLPSRMRDWMLFGRILPSSSADVRWLDGNFQPPMDCLQYREIGMRGCEATIPFARQPVQESAVPLEKSRQCICDTFQVVRWYLNTMYAVRSTPFLM